MAATVPAVEPSKRFNSVASEVIGVPPRVILGATTSPVNVALKSDASVKIMSSMTLRLLLPALPFAVADRNLISPPAFVPLPAPPRNIKSPPAPWSAAPPPRALPAVIVSVLPSRFAVVLANCVMVEAALSAPIVIAPVALRVVTVAAAAPVAPSTPETPPLAVIRPEAVIVPTPVKLPPVNVAVPSVNVVALTSPFAP